jgi:maltose alpha-D-glucosyltransferase/alpha-amylase
LHSYGSDDKQRIIVVANLSQFSQATTLNLSEFKNCEVTEVFSQNRFINTGEGQYSITVGPYGYFWFQMDKVEQKDKKEGRGNSGVQDRRLLGEGV